MAVTILQTPPDYSPAFNPMWFTCSGTHTANAGFNYVFYVDIDDWTGSYTNYATVRIPKRPDSVVGVFDASKIISDYVNTAIDLTNFGFYYNENLIRYKVRCDEEWTGSAAGAGTTLLTGYAFGGSMTGNEYLDWVTDGSWSGGSQYYTSHQVGGSNRSALTIPTSQNIYLNQNAWLSFIVPTANTMDKCIVTTYNSAGTLIGTYKFTNSYTATTTYPKGHLIRINTGTYGLNQVTLSSGSQPVITSSVATYKVRFYDTVLGIDNVTTAEYTYNILDSNCKYDNYRLHWLNKFGAWDSFNFNLVSRNSLTIDRQTFNQSLGTLTGTAYSYAKQDRRTIPFYVNSTQTIEINSDWITGTESSFLEELLTSSEVYWEQSTTQLIPVIITDKNYEIKKEVNDKLFNLTLKIQTTEARERQRY